MHEPKDHLADIEARLNAVEKTLVADEVTMEEAGEHESGDSESVRSTELAPTPATVVRPPPVLTSEDQRLLAPPRGTRGARRRHVISVMRACTRDAGECDGGARARERGARSVHSRAVCL